LPAFSSSAEHAARRFVDIGLDRIRADGIGIAQVDQRFHFPVQAGQARVRQASQQYQQGNHYTEADGQALADAQVIDVHRSPRFYRKKYDRAKTAIAI
jgi:hypothetical protein